MITFSRMTTEEICEFMAPGNWLSTEQSLVLTVVSLVTVGILIYNRVRVPQNSLLEMAFRYKELCMSKRDLPPAEQLFLEAREREHGRECPQWRSMAERRSEQEQIPLALLKSAHDSGLRARYKVDRQSIGSAFAPVRGKRRQSS